MSKAVDAPSSQVEADRAHLERSWEKPTAGGSGAGKATEKAGQKSAKKALLKAGVKFAGKAAARAAGMLGGPVAGAVALCALAKDAYDLGGDIYDATHPEEAGSIGPTRTSPGPSKPPARPAPPAEPTRLPGGGRAARQTPTSNETPIDPERDPIATDRTGGNKNPTGLGLPPGGGSPCRTCGGSGKPMPGCPECGKIKPD